MPPVFLRIIASSLVVFHLVIVGASLTAHRGTSKLHEDFLSLFDIYRTMGNWRMESNVLSLASSNDLSETVWIQWHVPGPEASAREELDWKTWPQPNRPRSFNLNAARSHRWLRQLADLLGLEINEGATQLLASATRFRFGNEHISLDRVRVMVAPVVSMARYPEFSNAKSIAELPEDLRPQIAFEASIVDLGNGQWSFLPTSEERRLSRATKSRSNSITQPSSVPAISSPAATSAPAVDGAHRP